MRTNAIMKDKKKVICAMYTVQFQNIFADSSSTSFKNKYNICAKKTLKLP